MTLTIEIEPETQRAIEGKAARLGVPVERYAAGVLRRDVESDVENDEARQNADAVTNARRAARRALEALAVGTRAGLPPIPDEALTSENLYSGRGEIAE